MQEEQLRQLAVEDEAEEMEVHADVFDGKSPPGYDRPPSTSPFHLITTSPQLPCHNYLVTSTSPLPHTSILPTLSEHFPLQSSMAYLSRISLIYS